MPFEEKEFSELISKFKEVKAGEKFKTDQGFKDRLRHDLMEEADKMLNKPSFWEQWRYVLIAAPSVLGVILITFALINTDFLFKPVELEGDRLEINMDSSTLPFDDDMNNKIMMPGLEDERLKTEDDKVESDDKNLNNENAGLLGGSGDDAATSKKSFSIDGSGVFELSDVDETLGSGVAESTFGEKDDSGMGDDENVNEDLVPRMLDLQMTSLPTPEPVVDIAPLPQLPDKSSIQTLIMPSLYTEPVGMHLCNLSVIYDLAIVGVEKDNVKLNIVLPLLNDLENVRQITVSKDKGKYRVVIEWCDGKVDVKYY